MSSQLPQSALPVSELLGLNRFSVQDGELDANNTQVFFEFFNFIQCQRNIRLYFRFAWKVIKLGLILGIYCQKLFSSSIGANYSGITYMLTKFGANRLLQLQPDITTNKKLR